MSQNIPTPGPHGNQGQNIPGTVINTGTQTATNISVVEDCDKEKEKKHEDHEHCCHVEHCCHPQPNNIHIHINVTSKDYVKSESESAAVSEAISVAVAEAFAKAKAEAEIEECKEEEKCDHKRHKG
jgi:hypothetical protein